MGSMTNTSEMNSNPSDTAAAKAAFKERYKEVLAKVSAILDQVNWNKVARLGNVAGILLVVIIAQVIIKGVLDTINLFPIVPGLLELLGLVIVGRWGWANLTTSEKRDALIARLNGLRHEYLG